MAKRSDPAQKRAKKADQLVKRTMLLLDCTEDEAKRLFLGSLRPSVRINPLAAPSQGTLHAMQKLGWKGEATTWCENGYNILEGFETLRDSDLVAAGAIYIQNEASWLPVVALNPQPGDKVLDVCAAPGGKASHCAVLMNNEGGLVANDNSRPRLLKLQSNLDRLHVTADYTLYDATQLSHLMQQQSFDKILLDAPCSGEGLITITQPKQLDTWSVSHIRRLAVLQKRLLSQAWQLLKPGGRLVYSTCTLAPEENEAVVDWFLRRTSDARIAQLPFKVDGALKGVTTWNEQAYSHEVEKAVRLIPRDGREAFFTCILERMPAETMS